ncbi:MAG: hypothetical protein IK097_09325 [Clostridia bacterium]|nr:hypothetical protein [Clostridia bacterium]
MKKALSVILAIALILSIPSVAFSAESGDTITRVDSDGNETTYEYGGELVIGSNEIKLTKNKYWVFTPDKSGVYAIKNDSTIFLSANVTDGIIGEFAGFTITDNYELYNFEADEPQYFLPLFASEDTESCKLTIEYFGEVKDLIYDESRILLFDEDVFSFEERSYIGDYFSLTFTESGKEEKLNLVAVKEPLKSGENAIEIDVLGKVFTVNLKVKSIEDYIAGFELPGYYNFAGYMLYNGTIIEQTPSYLIVNYTDGSSEKVAAKRTLLGEKVATLHIPEIGERNAFLHYVEDNLMLELMGHNYELGVKTRKADALMNTVILIRNISIAIPSSVSLAMLFSVAAAKDFFTTLTKEIQNAREYIAEEIRMYKEAL